MSHKSSSPAGADDFEMVPAGTHVGTCCLVAFIGWHMSPAFKDKQPEVQAQMLFTFELTDEKMKDGKPFLISAIHKDSLHVKANMRKMLECWRGKGFTNEELRGFEVIKLLGKSCFVAVIHKETGEQKELKARIAAVSKVTKKTEVSPLVSPPLYYTVEIGDPDSCDKLMLPQWVQKKVDASLPPPKARKAEPAISPGDEDEELPF